jgi:hypothetical protein
MNDFPSSRLSKTESQLPALEREKAIIHINFLFYYSSSFLLVIHSCYLYTSFSVSFYFFYFFWCWGLKLGIFEVSNDELEESIELRSGRSSPQPPLVLHALARPQA